jgi:hypothetical protein
MRTGTLDPMKTDPLITVLASRVHQLEREIAKKRTRIDTLERTKRRQKQLISGLYYELKLHRSRVRDARNSRDLWKHRCMTAIRGGE